MPDVTAAGGMGGLPRVSEECGVEEVSLILKSIQSCSESLQFRYRRRKSVTNDAGGELSLVNGSGAFKGSKGWS